MRQLLPQFIVATGLLFYGACATAIEEGNLGGQLGEDGGTSTGGTLAVSGSSNPGPGTGGAAPNGNGGKAGMPTTGAFGGTTTSGGQGGGGAPNGKAGSSAGGTGGSSSAGSGSGGKAGSSTGGSGTAGTGTSGSGTGGSGSGSGSAGSPSSTVCDGVPDWTSKTYAIGDAVANSCAAPFNAACPVGQSHKFECNPAAGAVALNWCKEREPGKGNGWFEAWVDKGQCQ